MAESGDINLEHREFIIIGLVAEDPSGTHAYNINKKIEERNMRAWTDIGKSSIYRIINDLEQKGLVLSYEEEHDNRIRRIYKITDNGMRILKKTIYRVLSEFYGHDDNNFYVAFSMLPFITIEKQVEAISHSIENIKVHIKNLEKMLEENSQYGLNVRGLFIHPIKILRTDIEFLKEVLEEIKNEGKNNG